jgi:hypothetical protein
MKRFLQLSALLFLVGTAGFAGCKKAIDHNEEVRSPSSTAGVIPNSLIGTWKLTKQDRFGPPKPTPNETVVFTDSNFAFYTDGQLKSSGTYAPGTATPCGSTPIPGLTFTPTGTNPEPRSTAYTLEGNQLVLDQGIACDAPRDTYERLR